MYMQVPWLVDGAPSRLVQSLFVRPYPVKLLHPVPALVAHWVHVPPTVEPVVPRWHSCTLRGYYENNLWLIVSPADLTAVLSVSNLLLYHVYLSIKMDSVSLLS